ncbi:hypothetical protein CVV38_00585 [Candidatus Peregrinibacteria bacterium HGW-Peregrinibacteria-1]|jgi:hypothetical protein|nr:MAG: hypothetical protein CVV38_00585 [Candidatus Peregrinibacteria bacterium HGW-Peregrinibacteria-1]
MKKGLNHSVSVEGREGDEVNVEGGLVGNSERLIQATRGELLHLLDGVLVSGIWNDSKWGQRGLPTGAFGVGRGIAIQNRGRERFRPSYALPEKHGVGGDLPFPLAMSWLSTGALKDARNMVIFPKDSDGSFATTMKKMGVLGDYFYADLDESLYAARDLRMPIYSVDDLPSCWDRDVVNSNFAMTAGNSKRVNLLSSFAADYEEISLLKVNVKDLVDKLRSGLFYIKLNNTENSGEGVKKCFKKVNGVNEPLSIVELTKLVEGLKQDVMVYGLNSIVAIQPHVDGVDRNFQIFVTPDSDKIHVVTLSEQFVDENGSYQSSINSPFDIHEIDERLERVIIDLADNYRSVLKAFGFVMCDYIETAEGELKVIDPGLRPTANTATAMAKLWLEEQTGEAVYSSLHFVKTGEFASFASFASGVDKFMSADSLVKNGHAVLPWGYNHHQGAGLFVVATSNRDDIEGLKNDVSARIKRR